MSSISSSAVQSRSLGNSIVESARIARGRVRDIATVDPAELDALVLPGGFGAAKNLCDFAVNGAACTVHPEVARVIRGVHSAGKPIGAACIAPAILARLLGDERPRVTIGDERRDGCGRPSPS